MSDAAPIGTSAGGRGNNNNYRRKHHRKKNGRGKGRGGKGGEKHETETYNEGIDVHDAHNDSLISEDTSDHADSHAEASPAPSPIRPDKAKSSHQHHSNQNNHQNGKQALTTASAIGHEEPATTAVANDEPVEAEMAIEHSCSVPDPVDMPIPFGEDSQVKESIFALTESQERSLDEIATIVANDSLTEAVEAISHEMSTFSSAVPSLIHAPEAIEEPAVLVNDSGEKQDDSSRVISMNMEAISREISNSASTALPSIPAPESIEQAVNDARENKDASDPVTSEVVPGSAVESVVVAAVTEGITVVYADTIESVNLTTASSEPSGREQIPICPFISTETATSKNVAPLHVAPKKPTDRKNYPVTNSSGESFNHLFWIGAGGLAAAAIFFTITYFKPRK